MKEFKVLRTNPVGTRLYEDFLVFESVEKADTWALEQNEHRPGSVVDLEEVSDYAHNEEKYEF